MTEKLKIILIFLAVCLIGTGAFYFFNTWKGEQTLKEEETQTVQNLKLLTSHSHPEAGENWVVSFETKGEADLTIIPKDQDTINDLDFVSLTCDGKEKAENSSPQVLDGDVIFYSGWQCDGKGEVAHLVNIARKHTLEFQFGDKAAFAYNNPDSVTDTFTTTSKIATTSNITVDTVAGQVKLSTIPLKANGESCSSGGECSSTFCIDGYCCNSTCGGNCDRCNVGGSLGICTDVNSDCTGNCDVCSGGNCAANNSLCNCDTCSGSSTVFNCLNDNVTTNWGAGTYGCGSVNEDKRCYIGVCKDCSDTGGGFYIDNCSCVSIRSGQNKVCWRKGGANQSCTTFCGSYGNCIAANWNDDTSCTVCMALTGYTLCSGGSAQVYAPYGISPASWAIPACYYRSSGSQTCSTAPGDATIYRMCVCQY